MPFSNRTSFFSSEDNPLTRLLVAKRERGERIWDLTETNPTRCRFRTPGISILENLREPDNLSYRPEPRGLLPARETIAGYYAEQGIEISPEHIFLTSGTSESYSHLFHLLADAGDEILTVAPGYPLLESVASVADVKLRKTRVVFERGWRLRMEDVLRQMEGVRAALFVNPANPTGQYLRPDEFEQLCAAASERRIPLISDEVFFEFYQKEVPRKSLCAQNQALSFTLNGISKMLGMPQMKLSWIVLTGPPELADESAKRLEHICDTFLSVGTPPQRALKGWLSQHKEFSQEVRDRTKANLEKLRQAMSGLPAEVLCPEGGWMAVLRLRGFDSDEAAALKLLQRKNTLVHPGYYYDLDESSFVVSLILEGRDFEACLITLSSFLKESN